MKRKEASRPKPRSLGDFVRLPADGPRKRACAVGRGGVRSAFVRAVDAGLFPDDDPGEPEPPPEAPASAAGAGHTAALPILVQKEIDAKVKELSDLEASLSRGIEAGFQRLGTIRGLLRAGIDAAKECGLLRQAVAVEADLEAKRLSMMEVAAELSALVNRTAGRPP